MFDGGPGRGRTVAPGAAPRFLRGPHPDRVGAAAGTLLFRNPQSFQKSLNRVGASSVYRIVF